MNKMITSDEKSVALEFVNKVRCYLSDATHSFFQIGYELHKAQQGQHFKALGYDSLEDLAEDAFGFSKTTTYDMIKVYNACKKQFAPSYMREEYAQYSFSQLVAMETGRYAGVDALTKCGCVKPTDSVRAIKKYVSYFNKYTDRHSSHPNVTLQEWLAQEEARQAELESSEQLQLGELVEEESEEQDETPGEIFRTSELQEVAEEESEIEEQEDCPGEDFRMFDGQVLPEKDITPLVVIKERNEMENVSRETEIETQRYTFENRAQARAFMSDYKNWEFLGNYGTEASFFLMRYRYTAKNYDMFFALEVRACKGIDEEGITLDNQVEYYLKPHGGYSAPFKVTKDQLEKYIAAHADKL